MQIKVNTTVFQHRDILLLCFRISVSKQMEATYFKNANPPEKSPVVLTVDSVYSILNLFPVKGMILRFPTS